MVVNLLKAISHENMEVACCVADVTYHYLAVCPKELGHILIIEFLSKPLTYLHGDHGIRQLQAWDCDRLQWCDTRLSHNQGAMSLVTLAIRRR